MAKASVHALKRPTRRVFDRTFVDPADPQYGCSCGCQFNAVRLGDALPKCPTGKGIDAGSEVHVVCENEPKIRIPFKLKSLSVAELQAAASDAEGFADRFAAPPGESPAEFLPPIDGQPVTVSAPACQVAAILCRAQAMPESDRYSVEEILCMMSVDALNLQICAAMQDVSPGATSDPLASTAGVLELSPTAAAETPRPIP